jgi:penicillin-binding protein 1A
MTRRLRAPKEPAPKEPAGEPRRPAGQRPTQRPSSRKRRRPLRTLLRLVPPLIVGAFVVWVGLFVVYAPELPDTDALFADAGQARVTLIAADGSVLAERGASGTAFVRLGEVSPILRDAVIATEDRRFYSHFGLDLRGTIRALVSNLRAGDVVAGGSTLTQQLAKNLFLTPERALRRKMQELILALWLEARLSKDEILELYLNRVYLGAGAYGVEAAAQRYFGKPAAAVDLAEAALIAGLLQAPSRFAPTNDLDRANRRAATVLRLMVETGRITGEQAASARASPASLATAGGSEVAGHFTDWVLDGLTEHLGKPQESWVVRTTLDPRLQRVAERAVAAELAGHAGVDAALVLLDGTGAIRAMVGGRSYRTDRFNRAAFGSRQPGSAFKPFVFLAALENGHAPGDRIDARPVTIGGWTAGNQGGRAFDSATLDEALARSINTVAVRLAQEVGPAKIAERARVLGIASELRPVPSLALGTSEVTPLELTAAYQPFATDGVRRPAFGVERVSDAGARVLYQHRDTLVQVVDPVVARQLRHMLASTVRYGSGQTAALRDRQVMGKTGTTQDNRDAWFVGFSGELVLGVWVGRDDNRPMPGISGADLPARIFARVMRETAPADLLAGLSLPVARPTRTHGGDGGETYVLHELRRWLDRFLGATN